jgi:RecA-family ATPase
MEDTVLPRLRAMKGNVERVYNLEGVVDKLGEDVLRFPQHALAIRDLMHVTQARLLVMDPVVSFLDKSVATHNDQSVRAALGLLAGMAAEERCAVLLVRHLNKERQRSLYRGGGSIGFLAAVRCAWLVAPDPRQAGVRVVAQVKNNLKALQPSLTYAITEAPGGGPQFS